MKLSDDIWSNDVDIDIENKNAVTDDENLDKYSSFILTNSSNNLARIESFESKLPSELSKDKKMSLLIVVLLQMVFNNDPKKLDKIYSYLDRKKLLNIEVAEQSYSGLRSNLSFMIESLNHTQTSSTSINPKLILTENPTSDLIINKYINKYRNNYNQINLLGEGAFGSVFKVFHLFEKKLYALKKIFITEDLVSDNFDIFKEVQLYSELNHTNIVRYYSSWVDIDVESILEFNKGLDPDESEPIQKLCPILFIQMELCTMTLKEYMLTIMNDSTIKIRINYFKQIIDGVIYLHSNNIIHRDLKPDNIFMIGECDNSILKLGDFGLCTKYPKNNFDNTLLELTTLFEKNISHDKLKKINSSTNIIVHELQSILMSKNVGIGLYKAPEVETGIYNNKIDIYSLGIIFLELLLNYTTIHEKYKLLKEILKLIDDDANLIIPHIISPEYSPIIILMLNKNPMNRPNGSDILEYLDNLYI